MVDSGGSKKTSGGGTLWRRHPHTLLILFISRPLGAYRWNLLSGRLEWSWVEIHGIATQD
ncbi:hypothetical protein HanXRQr2_Chr10g0441271 [Helianthus annuus]|uniref:Uncharacterized protein n=1 Tax=Helianthus annuus TaxID=4232 RepID=A0A251TIJ9_HELAN|nr:hypothetical protein HanXRQr2_Chr10g0441271 [Helianthus annuus]KAJ0521842.1 hypothetical protein HanIR_Chr10g0475661 [Helianthus annuus]